MLIVEKLQKVWWGREGKITWDDLVPFWISFIHGGILPFSLVGGTESVADPAYEIPHKHQLLHCDLHPAHTLDQMN